MSDLASWVRAIVEAVTRTLAERAVRPEATYRVQFHKDHFTFRDAAAVVPYLDELGVSHLYASPCRKARSGSDHGYAIVDYNSLNPALGGPDDYRAMVAALRAQGMGQILDIVPNHMSAAPGENPWWTDVLENGPGSPYARYFDIDWRPGKPELVDKVLLPVLGEQYGQVLESGELGLEYADGSFLLRYYDITLPLDPRTYAVILGRQLDALKLALPADSPELSELQSILTALEYLPQRSETAPERVAERQREKEIIKGRLRRLVGSCPAIADFVQRSVEALNGAAGDSQSFDRLNDLLDAQAYRLSHWKAAADEVNYRRFFDINELAAVCTEDPEVFENSHRLIFELLARGDLDGVRVDHIDGLFDPMEYLWRLQWGYLRSLSRAAYAQLAGARPEAAPAAAEGEGASGSPRWEELEAMVLDALWRRIGGVPPAAVLPHLAAPAASDVPAGGAAGGPAGDGPSASASSAAPGAYPLYVVVEKILGPEEPLPGEWPVAGTTGYDFLDSVNRLLVDSAGLGQLTRVYNRFIDDHPRLPEIIYESKRLILRVSMLSELQLLAHRLDRISEQHRRFRDFTLNTLRIALREVLACFPVYRTYIRPGMVSDRDRRFVHRAVAQAKRRNPAMLAAIFDFVRDVLLLEQPPALDEAGRRERALLVGRFQQVTSPVMAKAVEDTAFYRFLPLSSLNEVGSDPAGPGIAPEQFHQQNAVRRDRWPDSLLCTSTHDSKRSEDVRARINVLSEVPHLWRAAVNRWSRLNRRHRREVDGQPAPSRNDEYLFYQTLVGIWPPEPPERDAYRRLVERMQAYMEKATREAKLRTSWVNPNADYDSAVRDFVAAALEAHPKNRFLAAMQAFHEQVIEPGLYAALSQLLLKLTSPGVPDVYQGQELWNFSLVDPDNRRPVDFRLRRLLLADLRAEAARGGDALLALARRLGRTPRDSRLKLFVTWRTLQFRRRWADLFRLGRYVPLAVEGAKAKHACAFAWQGLPGPEQSEKVAVVVAPRWLAQLAGVAGQASGAPFPPIDQWPWEDTRVSLGDLRPPSLRSEFTGEVHACDPPLLPVAALLAHFPVALLGSA